MKHKVTIVLFCVSDDMTYINDAIDVLNKQYENLSFRYLISKVTKTVKIVTISDAKIRYILQQELATRNYDYLLVCGGRSLGVKLLSDLIKQYNVSEEKVLYDWIVSIPGFTKKKYDKLRKSRLSIVSMNCFGGVVSHTLGLPFLSPFINMFFSEKDFLKILKNFASYMHSDFNFVRMDYEQNLKRNYPVFAYDDGVVLNMNHYTNVDDAKKKWHERCERINYYNILVVMYTEDEEILKEFDSLPFSKKICFVPFETDVECGFTVDREKIFNKKDTPMWQCVNYYASRPFVYDVFDLLTYGILNKV